MPVALGVSWLIVFCLKLSIVEGILESGIQVAIEL
jgi:hypothetical protein